MKRLLVMIEEKPQNLSEISYLLSKSNVCIDDFEAFCHGGKAFIELECRPPERARELLESNGCQVSDSEQMMLLCLPESSGESGRIAQTLAKKGLSSGQVRKFASANGLSVVGIDTPSRGRAMRLLSRVMEKPPALAVAQF